MKEQRVERIEIRLTKEEKDRMNKIVDDSDQFNTISKLFRHRMFSDELEIIEHIISVADPDLIKEISSIGNNVNQLTKHVNSCSKSGLAYNTFELYEVLKSIDNKLTNLIKYNVEQSI